MTIVDMDYLNAVEAKARGELDQFLQNNSNTLNVLRLAKLGLIAEQANSATYHETDTDPQSEFMTDEE